MSFAGILRHGAKEGVIGSCLRSLIDALHSLLSDYGLFQDAEPPIRTDPALIA